MSRTTHPLPSSSTITNVPPPSPGGLYLPLHTRQTERVNIGQTGSIARYLAPMTGLAPKDPLEATVCDSYFEAAQDMMIVNPIINIFTGDQLEVRGCLWWTLLEERMRRLPPPCAHLICLIQSAKPPLLLRRGKPDFSPT